MDEEIRFYKLQEDVRGKVYKLEIEGQEYLLLTTKKRFRRGGELHNAEQRITILRGQILLITPHLTIRLTEGQCFTIGNRVPHYLEAQEYSVCLEWKHSGIEDKEVYVPYRKLVEEPQLLTRSERGPLTRLHQFFTFVWVSLAMTITVLLFGDPEEESN